MTRRKIAKISKEIEEVNTAQEGVKSGGNAINKGVKGNPKCDPMILWQIFRGHDPRDGKLTYTKACALYEARTGIKVSSHTLAEVVHKYDIEKKVTADREHERILGAAGFALVESGRKKISLHDYGTHVEAMEVWCQALVLCGERIMSEVKNIRIDTAQDAVRLLDAIARSHQAAAEARLKMQDLGLMRAALDRIQGKEFRGEIDTNPTIGKRVESMKERLAMIGKQ